MHSEIILNKKHYKGKISLYKEKELTIINYNNFAERLYIFPELQYKIAKDINDFLKSKYEVQENIASLTDICAFNENNKVNIIFGIMKNRREGNFIAEKYKITIEKLSDEQ